MAVKNLFLNGMAELLILYFLNQKDCYVYELAEAVTELSGGLLVISQNTLYTATYKLENENKISEYSRLVGKKRTRVYYHIEPKGKKYLEELMDIWSSTTKGISRILESKLLTLQSQEEILHGKE